MRYNVYGMKDEYFGIRSDGFQWFYLKTEMDSPANDQTYDDGPSNHYSYRK